MPARDAIGAVLQAGLIPIVEVDRSEGEPGMVTGQRPAANDAVLPGDLVRIRVRTQTSRQERHVDLRAVVGAEINQARRFFAETGTNVEVVEVAVPGHPYAGTRRVAAQYPVSSVPLSQARTITLWVVR
jgi:beta-lactam-binding protein with PASTA domain